MDSLFTDPQAQRALTPLAERMRPRTLSEVVGQPAVVDVLRDLMQRTALPSLILWGPPGSGKTTIARLLAGERYEFVAMSAVLAGVRDVKEAVEGARRRRAHDNRGTLLFLDEIHRFNKAQQDVLLPHVEAGTIVLAGATTENPSFEVIGPLLSRCRVLTLEALKADEIEELLRRAATDVERGLGLSEEQVEGGVLTKIAQLAAGDARFALNTLEVCAALVVEGGEEGTAGTETRPTDTGVLITTEVLKRALGGGAQRALLYDKAGDEHFNLISALHKSVRGSDPDAALYWLARMLEAGEDPKYIVRRLIRFASEDVGLADPWALVHAVAVKDAIEFIGMPECNNALAQLCVYLACAPKSNAMYEAYSAAREAAHRYGALPPPLHIRNAPTQLMKELGYGKDYKYAQVFPGGFVPDNYWPEELKDAPPRLLKLKGRGAEKTLAERLRQWWGARFEGEEEGNPHTGSASVPARDSGQQEKAGTTAVPGRRPMKETSGASLEKSQRKLPHWRFAGSAYFVTWRLQKNIPALSEDERSVVRDTIRFGAGKRFDLYAYVVMDDHAHVVLRPFAGEELPAIIHTWKSYTTNALQRKHRRQGAIWDSEYYDRIIRDENELVEKCNYVLTNPQRRWPEMKEYTWAGWE